MIFLRNIPLPTLSTGEISNKEQRIKNINRIPAQMILLRIEPLLTLLTLPTLPKQHSIIIFAPKHNETRINEYFNNWSLWNGGFAYGGVFSQGRRT